MQADQTMNRSRTFITAIYLNAFIIGAVIMSFEMLGSRYLNPYFGSGIYTWSALISTVLAALTIGYFIGGWVVDRWPDIRILGCFLAAAALYLAVVPVFAAPVSEAIFEAIDNIPMAALAAAMALLLLPLTLMGVYSPFAIRLVLDSTEKSGRTAGWIYGISTLGSIVGTLGTTFYLIPHIGTRSITYWLACVALLVGLSFILLIPAVAGRALAAGLALLLIASPLAPSARAFDPDALLGLPNGDLAQIESLYNNIFVTKEGSKIRMSFSRYRQKYTESVIDLAQPEDLVVPYTRQLTVGLAYVTDPKELLMIGLGGGSTSRYLLRQVPGLRIDSVELDPDVVEAAETYFGLKASEDLTVTVADGRVYLLRNKPKRDIIVVDAFRGGYVPFHLLTQEFYRLVQRRLNENGVAVLNVQSETSLFPSTMRTLRSVFAFVDAYRVGQNVIIVAGDGVSFSEGELRARAKELQERLALPYPLTDLLSVRMDPAVFARKTDDQSSDDGVLLTDDFAPANYLEAVENSNAKRW
ncbi:MAG: fused MFS/spermidine synthase [Pseudomonadota bacterium]